MTSLSVRVPAETVERLDELVAAGRYPTRTAAIQEAMARLLAEEREREIDRSIVEGYTRIPAEPPDEFTIAMARRSIREEPW